MTDIVYSTLNSESSPDARLKAIVLYISGVREDFPKLSTICDNVMILAGYNYETGEWDK